MKNIIFATLMLSFVQAQAADLYLVCTVINDADVADRGRYVGTNVFDINEQNQSIRINSQPPIPLEATEDEFKWYLPIEGASAPGVRWGGAINRISGRYSLKVVYPPNTLPPVPIYTGTCTKKSRQF